MSAKLSKKIVNDRLSGSPVTLIGEFINCHSKSEFECDKGHIFMCFVTSMLSKKKCPKCYIVNSKLTIDEINLRLIDRGITIVGEYELSILKTYFKCSKGHIFHATTGNVLSGKGCGECCSSKKLNKSIVNERLYNRNITLIGDYSNVTKKSLFMCENNHKWYASPSHVMSGTGCPHCAGCIKLTKDEVNKRISNKGVTLIGNYINNETKTKFRCICGKEWDAKPSSIFTEKSRCSACNKPLYGFDSNSSAILYYIKILCNGYCFYKIGITNFSVKRRFNKKDLLNISIIKITEYSNGIDAYNKEQEILKKYKEFIHKGCKILKNGNTEIFTKDVLCLDNLKIAPT